ncbi:MAG: YitT family protein [Clostridiales bacterium]|nr:YitT family protein [Clostridiales bacterium]
MALTPKVKKRLYNWLVVPLIMLLSGTIRAVVVHMFVAPYNFATSGVSGIAVMIYNKTGFSAGWTTLIINAPLLVLCFIFINKRCTIISGIAIAISAIFMVLMDYFKDSLPLYAFTSDLNPFFAAIAAGVLGGFGFALIIRVGGSTGGSDIVAMLLQKKFKATNISWFVYLVDAVIIFASMFVYTDDWAAMAFVNPVMLSLTEEFAHALVGDKILTGFKTAIKYEIVTDNPEEISAEIIEKLHRSVTNLPAVGMYQHNERHVLICIISKRQLGDFNKILAKYPNTFAYMISVNEVIGKGFPR